MSGPRFLVLTLAHVLLVGLLVPGDATRAADADVALKRADLESVQRRILELEKAIGETETNRSTTAERLAASERAVSAANRKLREFSESLAAAIRDLAVQEAERAQVEERIAQRQAELGTWLQRHYVHGGRDMAPFLSARDPNQLARDARYLEHLGRARLELIESLRLDLAEQTRLAESIALRRDELLALEVDQRKQQTELEKARVARARALEALETRLSEQQQEIKALRDNEQRLGRVVEILATQAAEREAERLAQAERRARAEAVAALNAREAAPAGRPHAGARSAAPGRDEGPIARPTATGVTFAQLRGKMAFPVRGELIGRFGAPRAEGGTRWRGVFIRANGGEDVLAVADGEVVFSDWLRGYGNLIILDHGDGYLTVYGNNDALYKMVGERIGGGMPIASVGTSAGAQGSGVYFEVRHQGQPVDPMQWIRGR